jgi:hypothetical protein
LGHVFVFFFPLFCKAFAWALEEAMVVFGDFTGEAGSIGFGNRAIDSWEILGNGVEPMEQH